jgi:hypothetical protein
MMTKNLRWVFDDGGRSAAGFRGPTGDCVVRAIAIVTEIPYKTVYNDINDLIKVHPRQKRIPSARTGVPRSIYHNYLAKLGAEWTPTMSIGSGCQTHLRPGEVPTDGRYIVRLSHHLTAVVYGVVYDTHDPSRGGTRCIYGHYRIA